MSRYISIINFDGNTIVRQCLTSMSDKDAIALNEMLHDFNLLSDYYELAITEDFSMSGSPATKKNKKPSPCETCITLCSENTCKECPVNPRKDKSDYWVRKNTK